MEVKTKLEDVPDPSVPSEKEASKRPEDSTWKQQRLPAWQPLLTPKWVIVIFSTVALVFIPLGIAVIVLAYNVVEVKQRYDNICGTPGVNVSYCTFNLSIPSTMPKPVYFYYELSNFYQNHRRYVKSRSDAQLSGSGLGSSLSLCDPVERLTDSSGNSLVIVPCGLIANSFFNDTFSASVCTGDACSDLTPGSGESADTYAGWRKSGIAWPSDVSTKFKYTALTTGYTNVSIQGFELPRVDDEDFIVWMRTAGLPTFRKLYRIISDRDLAAGSTLKVTVKNVFPVGVFSGSKSVILSTTTFFGGRNLFLGWAYIAVGSLSLLFAIIFLLKQIISPRQPGDMQYFHWPTHSSKDLDTADE